MRQPDLHELIRPSIPYASITTTDSVAVGADPGQLGHREQHCEVSHCHEGLQYAKSGGYLRPRPPDGTADRSAEVELPDGTNAPGTWRDLGVTANGAAAGASAGAFGKEDDWLVPFHGRPNSGPTLRDPHDFRRTEPGA